MIRRIRYFWNRIRTYYSGGSIAPPVDTPDTKKPVLRNCYVEINGVNYSAHVSDVEIGFKKAPLIPGPTLVVPKGPVEVWSQSFSFSAWDMKRLCRIMNWDNPLFTNDLVSEDLQRWESDGGR